MYRTLVSLTALAATALAWTDKGWVEREQADRLQLKEEALMIEYTATSGEATVVFEAESEIGMQQLQIFDPHGKNMGRLDAGDDRRLVLSGYIIETGERTLAEVRENFMPGTYKMSGRARNGRGAEGSAVLSHELLEAPFVLYPVKDAQNVPTNLTIGWIPDPDAVGYRVGLEQGDGDTLMVRLPAGSSSLVVPSGVLEPGKPSHVEVGALAANGNCTVVEIPFTTR